MWQKTENCLNDSNRLMVEREKNRHILYLKSLRFFLSFCCADDLCLLFVFEEVTFRVFYEFAKR